MDIGYSSSQRSKCCALTRHSPVSPRQILTTVMTNIDVNKSTDNAEPHLICFFYGNIQRQAQIVRQIVTQRKRRRCPELSRNLIGLFPQMTRAALPGLLSTTTKLPNHDQIARLQAMVLKNPIYQSQRLFWSFNSVISKFSLHLK